MPLPSLAQGDFIMVVIIILDTIQSIDVWPDGLRQTSIDVLGLSSPKSGICSGLCSATLFYFLAVSAFFLPGDMSNTSGE